MWDHGMAILSVMATETSTTYSRSIVIRLHTNCTVSTATPLGEIEIDMLGCDMFHCWTQCLRHVGM